MRTVEPLHAVGVSEVEDPSAQGAFVGACEPETWEIVRVACPECSRPIALLPDEEDLPEHALCPTRWDPFGLTVCAGSGRSALDAPPVGGLQAAEEDAGVLLTLPEGLDWRTQPFSHARRARPLRAA
jgi:hypothetical protein